MNDHDEDEDRQAELEFANDVNEEARYFGVLNDFVELIERYGHEMVEHDIGEILRARNR